MLNMLHCTLLSKNSSLLIPLSDLPGMILKMRARLPRRPRHEQRMITEQLVHILQTQPFRLRLETPEEDGVAQIANDENEVELPADSRYGNRRDLPDHRVESEARHGSPRDAFQPHRGSEHLRGNTPG